jgi:hypothetical protein
MNKNIVATFAFRFASSLSQGIWDYNALPQYIFLLEDQSSQVQYINLICSTGKACHYIKTSLDKEHFQAQAVGIIEGLQGTCTALAGFPGKPLDQIRWFLK